MLTLRFGVLTVFDWIIFCCVLDCAHERGRKAVNLYIGKQFRYAKYFQAEESTG